MNLSKTLVSVVVLAGAALACSSSSTTTPTTDAGGTDAKKDAIGNPDSGDSGGGGTCKPQDVSSFTPSAEPGPATAAGACTTQDVSDYYAFCFDPGDQTKCTALTKDTTKAACLKCLTTPESAAKWGALIEDDQGLVRNNIAGCLTIKGDTACATAIGASGQCSRAACPDTVCPVPDGDTAALNALNKCLSDSEKAGCKKYSDAAACANADDGSAAAKACIAPSTSQDDFKDTYLLVANAICVTGK
jgi:hypothetical protein